MTMRTLRLSSAHCQRMRNPMRMTCAKTTRTALIRLRTGSSSDLSPTLIRFRLRATICLPLWTRFARPPRRLPRHPKHRRLEFLRVRPPLRQRIRHRVVPDREPTRPANEVRLRPKILILQALLTRSLRMRNAGLSSRLFLILTLRTHTKRTRSAGSVTNLLHQRVSEVFFADTFVDVHQRDVCLRKRHDKHLHDRGCYCR